MLCYHYPIIESTNTAVRNLLPLVSAPYYCTTDAQTSGEGQRGATWHSEPQTNLLATYCLAPSYLTANDHWKWNRTCALAAATTLSAFAKLEIQLKWPNDLMIGDRKVGGLLVRNILTGKSIKTTMIGIGINLNQTDFPAHLAQATSVINESTHRNWYSPVVLGRQLASAFAKASTHSAFQATTTIEKAYQRRLYGLGELREFEDLRTNRAFRGTVIGTTDEGLLQVKPLNEPLRTYNLKEIKWIFK